MKVVMKQRGLTLIELLILLACVLIMVGAVAGPYLACTSQGKVMGKQTDWKPFQGCMVEYEPGKWVPMERYRVVD
jgi:Tfp pilus assembly protein PilE